MIESIAEEFKAALDIHKIPPQAEVEIDGTVLEDSTGIALRVLVGSEKYRKHISFLHRKLSLPPVIAGNTSPLERRYDAMIKVVQEEIVDPLNKQGYNIKFQPKPLSENPIQRFYWRVARL